MTQSFYGRSFSSVSPPGGVEGLHRCLTVWEELSRDDSDSEYQLRAVARMEQAFVI